MGSRAGAGLTIGVLSGSGSPEALLSNGANMLLPDVGYLKKFLDGVSVEENKTIVGGTSSMEEEVKRKVRKISA